MSVQNERSSLAPVAAKGLFWMMVATFLSKFTSVINQVALGYLVEVEVYAVFAIASAAIAMVAGLQDSGVSKIVIQKQVRDEKAFGEYTKFSLYMGLAGSLFLGLVAVVMAWFYGQPELVAVIGISAISVPLTSLSMMYVARGSLNHEFRRLALIDTYFSLSYSFFLIGFAYLGANYYSVAIATCLAWIVKVSIFYRYYGKLDLKTKVSFERAASMLYETRWIMLGVFLFGFSQQGAYLILGRVIDARELGLFYFGFMLTANVGNLATRSIANVLMPIFSTMQKDISALGKALFRSSGAISFFCGGLAIAMMALAPSIVHFMWQSKWDLALFTALVMAGTLPIRVLSSLGAITLEARGHWRLRTLIVVFDVVGMMVGAGVGGMLGGLPGAAIGAGIQRVAYGLVVFTVASLYVESSRLKVATFIIRVTLPFLCATALLFALRPELHIPLSGSTGALTSLFQFSIAMVVFVGMTAVTNRESISELIGMVQKTLRRKQNRPNVAGN